MKWAQSFDEFYKQVRLRKVPFLIAFAIIVTLSYAVLYVIDFVPEPISEETQTDRSAQEEQENATAEVSEEEAISFADGYEEISEQYNAPLPRKIIFDSLDKEIPVENPQSREIADLDEALLSGAVRHPDSADFSEEGNIFILGHSSYLPNVFNKNFQAFNGIQDLTWGDTIRVQSDDAEYLYRVNKVYKARASEVIVPHTPGEAKLTLATCNSFGSKDDRFIVEASLVRVQSL